MTLRQQAELDQDFLEACQQGMRERLEAALKDGANVHAVDVMHESGLHLCLGADEPARTGIVQRLLTLGVNLNGVSRTGETPLSIATSMNAPLTGWLLDSGADVSLRNDTGWTPLHNVAANGNLALLEKCLEKGADPNAKNENGTTPLHQAAQYGCVEVASVLIDLVDDACRAAVRQACKDMGWHAVMGVFEARDARMAVEAICRQSQKRTVQP